MEINVQQDGTKQILTHPSFGLMSIKAVKLDQPMVLTGTQSLSNEVMHIRVFKAHQIIDGDEVTNVADDLVFSGYMSHAEFSKIIGNIGSISSLSITHDQHLSLANGLQRIKAVTNKPSKLPFDSGFLADLSEQVKELNTSAEAMLQASGKKQLKAVLESYKQNLNHFCEHVAPEINETAVASFDDHGAKVLDRMHKYSQRTFKTLSSGDTLKIEQK